jgi:radical SAM protein with 4Fe4S-binding SPASM domain
LYNMAIEPNGDVIPCQSYYKSMGNILTGSWESIWNSDLAKSLRDRTWVEEKCKTCDDLNLCGGGCPLYAEEHSVRCVESQSTAP